MRLVSLTCSNTEIVCALGKADWLVGVDDYSDYPPVVVAQLPRVGPDLGIDIEKVAELEPDLVLASLTVPGHEKVVAGLEAAGLPYIAPSPKSLADVYDDIRDIGRRLGMPQHAESVAAEMQQAIESGSSESESNEAPSDKAPSNKAPSNKAPSNKAGLNRPGSSGQLLANGKRPRVAVQWWPKPVILPGRQSWVHDLIEYAGGSNLLGDRDVESAPLEDDEMAALAPDVIVLSWCGVDSAKYRPDVIYRNPAFADLPAVVNRQVVIIPEAYLGRPSPRLAEGCRRLRAAVASALA